MISEGVVSRRARGDVEHDAPPERDCAIYDLYFSAASAHNEQVAVRTERKINDFG